MKLVHSQVSFLFCKWGSVSISVPWGQLFSQGWWNQSWNGFYEKMLTALRLCSLMQLGGAGVLFHDMCDMCGSITLHFQPCLQLPLFEGCTFLEVIWTPSATLTHYVILTAWVFPTRQGAKSRLPLRGWYHSMGKHKQVTPLMHSALCVYKFSLIFSSQKHSHFLSAHTTTYQWEERQGSEESSSQLFSLTAVQQVANDSGKCHSALGK